MIQGKDPVLDFIARTPTGPVPMRARYLGIGARYGTRGTLMVTDEPRVEFTDRRYRGNEIDGVQHGEFTGGRYYTRTISAHQGPLNLHGEIPSWSVDKESMTMIKIWLIQIDHRLSGLCM